MTNTTDHTAKASQLQQALRQFTGTEHWWTNPLFSGFSYTDGVKYLAGEAGAYWLIDAIFSHQCNPKVKAEGFQEWRLKVSPDNTAVLTCSDGNCNEICRQEIAFTDFPLDEIALYLMNAVLLLPSEY
jgi:hypothetical protein